MAQITGCLQKNKLFFTILAILSAALLCTALLYAVLSRMGAKNLAACSFCDGDVFPKEEIFDDCVQPGCKSVAKEERIDEHVVESKAVIVEDSPTESSTASLSVTSDVDEGIRAVDQELEGANEVVEVVQSVVTLDCDQSNPSGDVVQVAGSDKDFRVAVDDVEPLEDVSGVLLGCKDRENNEVMITNTDESGLLQCDRGKSKGRCPNGAMRLVNKGLVRSLIDWYNELDRVALLEAKRASKNFRGTFSSLESAPDNPRKVGEIMAGKDNEE
ncbi:hypothetical protein VCUG_02142 [Vavraia culicis subsp. floridensis]|uniref:Uncharacterized protein n=1 Tax=Vavraia culicis (isolate floridensis) TaxID=948595 RepID=L2GSY7_VAVCU|nr:uncharacterized protein VCUG_02142 [Vavraia culicis subsp. floridensis]ELA46378.1 hypothetical protein VCUG_02142 [Vavraia culicis subsp. floridensis]